MKPYLHFSSDELRLVGSLLETQVPRHGTKIKLLRGTRWQDGTK